MAGFTMPKRGSGAAMLRDLREDERPPLEDEPAPRNESESSPIQTPLAETPPVNTAPENFTQSEIDEIEAEMHIREDSLAHSQSHMTSHIASHMADNMTDKQTAQKTVKQPGKPAGKKAVNTVSQKERQSGNRSEGQSVAEMIRRRASAQAEPEVLKTVTLKLSPSLDERIERYCFDHKMKKQEFWAEAAALYFETLENAGE